MKNNYSNIRNIHKNNDSFWSDARVMKNDYPDIRNICKSFSRETTVIKNDYPRIRNTCKNNYTFEVVCEHNKN